MQIAAYNKALVAIVGVAASFIFDQYGAQLGLPPGWPETITLAVTPVLVYLLPNKAPPA